MYVHFESVPIFYEFSIENSEILCKTVRRPHEITLIHSYVLSATTFRMQTVKSLPTPQEFQLPIKYDLMAVWSPWWTFRRDISSSSPDQSLTNQQGIGKKVIKNVVSDSVHTNHIFFSVHFWISRSPWDRVAFQMTLLYVAIIGNFDLKSH